MSLLALFKQPGPSGFGFASSALEVVDGLDLSGRVILVTGSASGLGLETCRALVSRGAVVLGLARTEAKAREAAKEAGFDVVPVAADLGELATVRAAVQVVRARGGRLDAIIANAGIMALQQRELICGVEKQLFVNHFGHFALITGLLDILAPDARVVVLSSDAHRRAAALDLDDLGATDPYTPWGAYGRSKLANLLFARELARRFAASGEARTCNALHPGVIATPLARNMPLLARWGWALASPIAMKTPGQGAATQVWAAVHPGAAELNGAFLMDCNLARSSARGEDMAMAASLWAATERVLATLA